MLRTNVLTFTAMVSVFVAAASSQAGLVVPEGLQPGDPYHLVFVTDNVHDALSSDIADYNQFVNDEAALNRLLTGTDEGVEWFAIASTETTTARDNAVVGIDVPVYLLDGTTKVVDGFLDIWDGFLDAPIMRNQFLANIDVFVWTGSTVSGGSKPGRFLGAGSSEYGQSGFNNNSWIHRGTGSSGGFRHFYALSQLLIVPEPGTASLLLIASALAWVRRRRRPAGQTAG